MTTEPRIDLSAYNFAASFGWIAAFGLIALGWKVENIYLALLGVGISAAAASATVVLCCWRMHRNIQHAFELGRDFEHGRVRQMRQ